MIGSAALISIFLGMLVTFLIAEFAVWNFYKLAL